jgi:virulence factor Mce-like protein
MSKLAELNFPARALIGAISTVLILAVVFALTRIALGALIDRYRVSLDFGESGQIAQGSDVVIRGVTVGEVGPTKLTDDLGARVQLVIDPQYKIPKRADFQVAPKTFFGEKQLEVKFEGPFDQGPFLEEGAVIDDPDRVVEVQDVLANLTRLLNAVETGDLATFVNDGLGAFDNQGELIARNVIQGERGTNVGRRSLDDQIASNRDLSLVASEFFGQSGTEFNELASESLGGLPTINDNQAPLRQALADLERFSAVFDATLEVDRENIDRLIIEGDSVTRMLTAYAPEVGELLNGLKTYTDHFVPKGVKLPGVTGRSGLFEIKLDMPTEEQLCGSFPVDVRSQLPGCSGSGGSGGSGSGGSGGSGSGGSDGSGGPQPPDFLEIPVPRELTRPRVPERSGIGSAAKRTLPESEQPSATPSSASLDTPELGSGGGNG